MKVFSKKIIIILFIISFLGIFLVFLINEHVDKKGGNMCNHETSKKQTALVLGARVWGNGEMSDIFKDRVETAISLYKDGKVEKILVSGDHGRKDYDEVNTAKKYLLANGVTPEDIFLDHAGFDTYDSLYRARDIFLAESLIIVTQEFHLPRALYIANGLGIDACGISSDLHRYYGETKRNNREVLAKIKAWFDITFNSKPKYLGNQIPLSGSGLKSWD